MRFILAGASGFLGRAACRQLSAQGHSVSRLVRRQPRDASEHYWEPGHGRLEAGVLLGQDVVVCLSGAGLADAPWTPARKQELHDSRIDPLALLANCLASMPKSDGRPAVLISASGVGFYGTNRGAAELDEAEPPGEGFLAQVCREWEAAALPAMRAGLRCVQARLGVVLSWEGGALPRMALPFRLCVGGRLGRGHQYMSWLGLEDLGPVIEHLASCSEFEGPVNACAPLAPTNAQLSAMIGQALRRPVWLPVPALALKIMLGEMAEEMLLAGQRAIPRLLLESGYKFREPELAVALRKKKQP